MKRVRSDLELLFDTVDNWFSDIAYRVPLSSPTECTLAKDQAKLAQIRKTTLRWFVDLKDTLTDEGIDDEDDNSLADNSYAYSDRNNTPNPPSDPVIVKPKVINKRNTRKCKPRLAAGRRKSGTPKEEQNIDKLAKDLERILEQADEIPTPALPSIQYFNTYSDDELALLDETIGASCMLVHSNNSHKVKEDHPNQASKWSCLTDNSKSFDNKFSPPRIHKKSPKNSHLYSQTKSSQNWNKVQTPCLLLDHDYLPKVPVKPLVLNNKLIQCARQTQIPMPVLNVAALRKFARFSDQFRRISMEHDKILAICNE